jgi:alpha-glucosidase
VLGNQDKARVATRLGAEEQARLAAMLLLTLRGTPTIYYGDEIGMRDVPISPQAVQDPWERNAPGFGRDPCRTPMQWDASPTAGFSNASPWLPVAADFPTRNVAGQRQDSNSMLSLYRRLIHLRQREPALSVGHYREVSVTDKYLVFERVFETRRLAIALNFSSIAVAVPAETNACVLLSTRPRPPSHARAARFTLQPFEGVITIAHRC